MKRTSSGSNDDDPSKKQKVAKNETSSTDDEPQPQTHLMPFIPAIPPVAPPPTASSSSSETQTKKRPKTLREYHNMAPLAKVYSAKDYELWPTIAVNVYRAQINIHNRTYASDMIRYWFDEHQGLRTPPPSPPRSSYVMFFTKQKSLAAGKKCNAKSIGALWKVLGEDEKTMYGVQYEKVCAQHAANEEYWENHVCEWRIEKELRLINSGVEMDSEKRIALKLNSFCECKLCKAEGEEE